MESSETNSLKESEKTRRSVLKKKRRKTVVNSGKFVNCPRLYSEMVPTVLPAFHRAVVLPLETMLLSEFCRDCSFITGSAGGTEELHLS